MRIKGISESSGKALLLVFGTVFFAALGQPDAFCAEKRTIAIISSRAVVPYNDAAAGFKEKLSRGEFDIVFRDYELEGVEGRKDQFVREIDGLGPDLIFSVGTQSTLFAKANLNGKPLVFSMVLNPLKAGIVDSLTQPGNNLTGVSLDIRPQLQFNKLKQMLPKSSRVGVIYNAQDKDWIREIEAAGKREGLTIVAKPVNSQSDVPKALDAILGEIDCLWGQADSLIYNAQSSQYIILTLLRNKIPFMVFSSQYVKAGALFALECDYGDIGRQSADIAAMILKGRDPGSIPVVLPEKNNLAVNRRIAQLIGVDISGDLLLEAKDVY